MKILVLISSEVFYVLTPYGVHGTQHWQSSSSSPSKFSLIILLEAKFCLGLDVTCRYLVQISRWMCRINLQFCSKFQVPEAIGIRILGCSPKKKKNNNLSLLCLDQNFFITFSPSLSGLCQILAYHWHMQT